MKDDHPAIISRKDWEAVQKIRKSREKKTYPYTNLLCCPYCGASLIRVVQDHRWVSWICATYMQKGKAVCAGMRIAEEILQKISKATPIIEMMVIEEVMNAKSRKNKTEEDFRLIPAAEYNTKESRNGN